MRAVLWAPADQSRYYLLDVDTSVLYLGEPTADQVDTGEICLRPLTPAYVFGAADSRIFTHYSAAGCFLRRPQGARYIARGAGAATMLAELPDDTYAVTGERDGHVLITIKGTE